MVDRPIVLLPVRLETRVEPRADGNFGLKIRVYPDDVAIDAHDPRLTADELAWARDFRDRSALGAAARADAWASLVGRYGQPRSAWLAGALDANGDARDDGRPSAWSRAPRMTVLPDRWLAYGYRANNTSVFTAMGAPIPPGTELHTGPDPGYPGGFGAGPGADPESLWLVDFGAALSRGMAIEVTLTPDQRGQLDRVLVVGWRAVDGQAALEQLLSSHHYTGGLGLVAQGTPTNNTPETPAGDVLDELTPAESLDLELGPPQMGSQPAPDGLALANALRVSRSLFDHVRRASGVEQLDAQQMNTALWPATWGYFLSRMMTGAFAFDDVVDANALGARARQHFIAHVRARGPLPALRIGRQPYGVLPAISLDRWANVENDPLDTVLVNTLRSLRPVWATSAASVPQVSGVSARADDDLVAILGNDAISSSYQGRPVVGPGYFDYLFRFLSTAMREWWTQQKAEAPPAQSPIQFPTSPLVSRAVFPGEHFVLGDPLVRPRPDLAADLPLPANQNYLSWLRGGAQSTYVTIALRRSFPASGPLPGDGGATPLLYRLLRHAALLEYQAGAFWYLATPPAGRQETELINISPRSQDATTTVWNMLVQAPPAQPGMPIGRVLDGARSSYGGWVPGRFHEFWAAVDHLAQRPAGALEQLMAETLDLCSFRLDAWITSMAHKRLATVQNQAAAGVYLGGYGWVEQLSSALQRPPSSGFVHTASLDQAATAAVLRSGYLAHRNGGPGGPFAVDLSSERVRLARWLLEGTRTQPLGALLGYRFERGLHEHQPPLDQYIAAFRRLAPLDGPGLQPGEAALTNVVDGLALNRLSKQPMGIPWGAAGFPPSDPLDALHAGVQSVLDALDRTVDAASDAVLAEGVYQTVRGNPQRAGAILDAVARGEVAAPELQFPRTPRSGVGVTQRVVVLFGGDPTLDAAWTPGPMDAPRHARAIAEPLLNAWAGQLLGDPRRVRCRAEYIDPQTGDGIAGLPPVEVRLADLGLCPLDVVFLSASSDRVQAAELEQRLAHHLLSPSGLPPDLAPVIPPGAGVRLAFGRDPAWPADVLSFPELLEVARGVRTLIQGARALAPADLTPRPAGGTAVLNVVDVQNRAQTVLTALGAIAAQLAAWDLTTRREGLLRAAHLGIAGAVPLSAAGETSGAREALDAQIAVIAPEVSRRLAAASAVTLPANPTADDQVARAIGQLQAVLEPAFRVLPRFQPANGGALHTAFDASTSLQGGDDFQASTWLQRMARVRDGVSNLAAALAYAQAVGPSTGQLRVAQLPYQAGDVWAGVPGTIPNAASLGLVAHVPAGFGSGSTTVPSGGDIGGLFVDEIVEVVPADRETTGVAFNYDQPNARAPQAILVAVPPTADPWSAEALAATVLETVELARIRGVDPDALRQAGQFLPALYVAANLALDTVATDFTGFDQSHPALAPNDAQFVSQFLPGPVIAGELFTIASIIFRNAGLSTWTSAGPHAFRLGWAMPTDGSAWSAPNQFDLPGGPVAPGDQVAFSLTLRAPAQAGVRSLMWRMMQVLDDGPHPFGAPTSVANFIIAEPVRNAAYVTQAVPISMAINETATVSLTFRNTGNSTWRAATGYCLGSQSPRDNDRWGLGRVGLSAEVPPGGQTTFTFTITAPARAGTYAFRWGMLQELITWFGEFSLEVPISVYDPKDKDTKESDKFGPIESAPLAGTPVPAGLLPRARVGQTDPDAPGAATFIQPEERPTPGEPPLPAAEKGT